MKISMLYRSLLLLKKIIIDCSEARNGNVHADKLQVS